MNTMTMERPSQLEYATITVAYVNEKKAGQRNASIKDTDDLYYWVKPEDLHNYVKGGRYEISFVTTQSNGYTNRTIKSAEAVQPARPQQQQRNAPVQQEAPQTNHADYNRQTHPADARRMWICAQMTALIKSHQIVVDPVALTEGIDMLAKAYDQSVLGNG